mmetsp:Transcript_1300/g.3124  ORF Transcript_1300/g.3124 Transcript_1300/m.3124 type:complete len:252 (+) Transcript_1300:372-1127(+)
MWRRHAGQTGTRTRRGKSVNRSVAQAAASGGGGGDAGVGDQAPEASRGGTRWRGALGRVGGGGSAGPRVVGATPAGRSCAKGVRGRGVGAGGGGRVGAGDAPGRGGVEELSAVAVRRAEREQRATRRARAQNRADGPAPPGSGKRAVPGFAPRGRQEGRPAPPPRGATGGGAGDAGLHTRPELHGERPAGLQQGVPRAAGNAPALAALARRPGGDQRHDATPLRAGARPAGFRAVGCAEAEPSGAGGHGPG